MAKPPPTIKDLERQNRELRKSLKELTQNVSGFLARLDAVMQWPSTEDRGQRLAAMSNALDLANDMAMHFGLKEPIPKITKRKDVLAKREEQP